MMPTTRPRIRSVKATDHGAFVVDVMWHGGHRHLIDLADMVGTYKVFAPLRSGELFQDVRVGENGWDIVWNDEIDISADTLWRLAQEQSGKTMSSEAFRTWRKNHNLTLDRAADLLGLSRRMVAYYDSGEKPIPRTVMLATRALDGELQSID